MRIMSYGVSALALAAASLLPLGQAQAQAIGFVTTLNGSIFPPQSSPGGQWSLTQLGTGQYRVTFYGLGNGINSNVQVTAKLFTTPHYCTSAGWYSTNGTDVTVNVDCFDTSGNPLNEDFSVFYQARTAAPASGYVAFLWGDQPTTPLYTPDPDYSYNSTGGTNTVTRENTGIYFAYLPGIKKLGGNVQVTAYGGGAARCQVVDWYTNHSGTNAVVYCVNAAGQATDEYFSLAYTQGATEAVGLSTSLGAYAWANSTAAGGYTPSKKFQWNNVSTKKLTDDNIGGGISFLSMSVPKNVLFNTIYGQVTAYGSNGEYCDDQELGYFGSAKHEKLTMTVACFNAQGQPTDTDYSAAFITTQ